MTENDVRVLFNEALGNYEKDKGLPRHEENLNNFAKLFAIVNKTSGGITVIKWLGGILTLAITATGLIIAFKR